MRTRDLEDEVLRRMSPEQKLSVMHALIWQAYELKAAWLRTTRPDLSPDEVHARAREMVYGSGRP